MHAILVIRQRGKLTAQDRLRQVPSSPCFDDLPDTWTGQVSAVQGDLAQEDCGLSGDDLRQLQSRVTRIIHCAASIEFDLPVADAAEANITSAPNIMRLARRCSSLRSVVSVSTAYVTPHLLHTKLEERLVPVPWDVPSIYSDIQAGSVATEDLLRESGHPNSYTLMKWLAEHLLVSKYSDLPLSIVRPSIISASRDWPVPGWLDSRAAIVPCDVVAHHILAWLFADEKRSRSSVPIRHSTVGLDQATTIGEARDEILGFFSEYPVEQPPASALH